MSITNAPSTSSTRSTSSDNSFIVSLSDNDLKTREEVEEAEEALAREMEKMSLQERERILLDVHGARQEENRCVDINSKLKELQRELSLISHKHAYDRALALNRGYVTNPALLQLFLRTEHYCARKAAKRLVSHFEVKLDLFVHDDNDDVLVRDILWGDLEEQDRWIASSGIFQFSSQRDNAGRAIFFLTPHALPPGTRCDSLCRAFWYVLMSCLMSDEHIQTKGIVGVEMNLERGVFSLEAAREIFLVHESLPIQTMALHCVYPHISHRQNMTNLQVVLLADHPQFMCRLRNHHEDTKTVVFKLQTFGIPMNQCPATTTTSNANSSQLPVAVSRHLDWLEAIQDWERSKKASTLLGGSSILPTVQSSNNAVTSDICILPRRFDVLFGKNKEAREHTGTLRSQHLVNMHWEEYEKASRCEKTRISDLIVSLIHQAEGRFLRWEKTSTKSGRWVVVDDDLARDKISHMFRNMRAAKARQQEPKQATKRGRK